MRFRTAIAALLVAVGVVGFVVTLASGSGYQVKMPSQKTTVLHNEEPARLALDTSRALYEKAPIVVLAGAKNGSARSPAASVAVSLGAPLLLVPSSGESGELSEELERLGTDSVLVIGDEPGALADALPGGVDLAQAPPGHDLPEQLPTHDASRELGSLTFLVNRGRGSAAAARAAGARVIVISNGNPRALPAAVAALSQEPPETVMAALDRGPADEELLDRRLELAATGSQLPGGGQVLFPYRRMVALYGHPGAPELGALGEQSRGETMERAKELAAEYEPIGNIASAPALEIIATIASQAPGDDGNYSIVTPLDVLRPWIEQARRAGIYVVLDLQPGRADFLTQAKYYEEFLAESHVGLALDAEWRLQGEELHLEQIGSVDAAEINEVITWLAALTSEHMLPQKLLILHQFGLDMITNRDQVDTSHEELAVLLHADGHGTPELKLSTWDLLTKTDPPPRLWWGWKNFYDEDDPLWTPRQTTELRPRPFFISYQ